MFLPRCILLLGVAASLTVGAQAAVELKEEEGKVSVTIGGEPFTEYHYTGAPHVYFYPLLGPGGARMTRDYPMAENPAEEHDHPHHRSLWFAHGVVNGVDFWGEEASYSKKNPAKYPLGKIVHEKFLTVQGGEKEGTLSSLNQWVAADGTIPLTSTQTVRFYDLGTPERMFDFDVTLKAGAKDVTMGDSKEGSMALRLAESMRLTQPKNKPPGQGHLFDSEGHRDGDVWSQHAHWVDYSGPVEGKVVGVTFLEHPKNPRSPTRWHARDYGLFAANPFAEHDMVKSQPEGAGDLVIKAGDSLTLRYRFLLHEGAGDPAKIAEQFAAYAKTEAPAGP